MAGSFDFIQAKARGVAEFGGRGAPFRLGKWQMSPRFPGFISVSFSSGSPGRFENLRKSQLLLNGSTPFECRFVVVMAPPPRAALPFWRSRATVKLTAGS